MSMARTIARNIAHDNMRMEGIANVNNKHSIRYDKDTVVFRRRGKRSRPVLKRSWFAMNWRMYAAPVRKKQKGA